MSNRFHVGTRGNRIEIRSPKMVSLTLSEALELAAWIIYLTGIPPGEMGKLVRLIATGEERKGE